MDIFNFFIDFILHLDQYLSGIVQNYGIWTYAILFLIIFLETGLVVMPFLPGDSLLFAAGTFAALGSLNVWLLWAIVFVAAVMGDTVNYWLGNKIGPRAFNQEMRFLKREYLEKTQEFHEKHGGKMIVLARFVPVMRTFAPFVAGVGSMNYGRFLGYNVVGAFLWSGLFIFLGYFFGNIPFVKNHFEFAILAVVLVSAVPMAIEFARSRTRKQQSSHAAA